MPQPVGTITNPDLMRIAKEAGLINFRAVTARDLQKMLGVSPSRITALFEEGRILAFKFTTKCWIVFVDEQGKPFATLPDSGPQPEWADKVNVLIRHRYLPGRKARPSEKLDKVEAELESIG